MCELARASKGQIVAWMSKEFLAVSAKDITESSLDFESIIQLSVQDGSSALSQWFRDVDYHISVLEPVLERTQSMYNFLCQKCGQENVSVEEEDGQFYLKIRDGPSPPSQGKPFSILTKSLQGFTSFDYKASSIPSDYSFVV
jgi:hypothetical protein